MINDKVLNSPIRWAGSKKKILNEMLSAFKKDRENYIECFLGSGIVLINVLKNNKYLNYKKFFVNDINSNIINFYKLLKTTPEKLIDEICVLIEKYNKLDILEKENYYYIVREQFNVENNINKKSAMFYFLMKTGFNGVYRENKSGNFNVPFGRKEKVIIDCNYLYCLSELIQPVEFYNLDYQEFLTEMKNKDLLKNSFMYFDPPYIPEDLSVSKKQELYTKDQFDHIKFFDYINNLKCKYVMISMSDSKNADLVYWKNNYKKNKMKDILRTINPKKLFPSKEVAFTSYEIKIK